MNAILPPCRYSRNGFDMRILFSAAETMIWLQCCKKYCHADSWCTQMKHNKVTIPYSLKDIPLSRALFLTCPMASSRVAIK